MKEILIGVYTISTNTVIKFTEITLLGIIAASLIYLISWLNG